MKEKIKQLSEKYFEDVLSFRRQIHQNPELAFEEYETSAFVMQKLDEFKIPYQKNVAKTGVVALLEGKNPTKKTIALRADMDALPIQEANEVSYKSKNPGKMHACGHDVHTASMLGAAKILSELKNDFEGTIKFIFQPSEEKLPGGASVMIKEGVLENPKPDGIVGQHVMPFIDAGKVGFRSGKYMASADEIEMTLRGKGGHAAMPHLANDTVAVLAQIITALQQIVSRNANPLIPSVLSFCTIRAGEGAYNVLPNEVQALGTFRTMNEKWRAEAHQKMKKMAEQIAESMGASCEFFIRKGYPVLENEPKLTAKTRQFAEIYLGKENVEDLDLWMAAEDFAYYSQVTNACFYRLGTRNEAKGITSPVHTPTFNIDESTLTIGMGLMAFIAINLVS